MPVFNLYVALGFRFPAPSVTLQWCRVSYRIPFNKPFVAGDEAELVARCLASGHTSGDGPFTTRCQQLLERRFGAARILLTTSCTSALEMAALLCDVAPGDEVILPSYTFVSTANAFLLRGATAKFVDIHPDTLNMDERLVEQAITPRTKVIVPVHYASIGCEMAAIGALARKRSLFVVEKMPPRQWTRPIEARISHARHARRLQLPRLEEFRLRRRRRAARQRYQPRGAGEIVREKGTNRSRFFAARWTSTRGSMSAPRMCRPTFSPRCCCHSCDAWTRSLHDDGASTGVTTAPCDRWPSAGSTALPTIPEHCNSNYHMFQVIVADLATRSA